MGPNERALTALVLLAICGLALWRFILWLREANSTPDPWGEDVQHAIEQEDALPLCPHCLSPQDHNGWFCPECGSTVGPYANYMPYIYLFSQGEVLRAGVTARFRHSPLIITGYILLVLAILPIAAPFYWFFLFKNLSREQETNPA
jgi:hypothetical protein